MVVLFDLGDDTDPAKTLLLIGFDINAAQRVAPFATPVQWLFDADLAVAHMHEQAGDGAHEDGKRKREER